MERLYTSPVSQRRTLWLWELKKTTIWRWHVLRISSGTFFMTACHYSPSGVRACYKTSHLPIKMILGRWPIYSGVIMTGITVVCCLNVSSWNSLGLGFGAIGLAGRGCTKQYGTVYSYCCSLFARQYPVRVRVSFRVKVFVSHLNLLHLLGAMHCCLTRNFMPLP